MYGFPPLKMMGSFVILLMSSIWLSVKKSLSSAMYVSWNMYPFSG